MNCFEFEKNFYTFSESYTDSYGSDLLNEHLLTCASCSSKYLQSQKINSAIQNDKLLNITPLFKENVFQNLKNNTMKVIIISTFMIFAVEFGIYLGKQQYKHNISFFATKYKSSSVDIISGR